MILTGRAVGSSSDEEHRLREGTKQALLVAMMSQRCGATISELVEATGWKANTVHAALSTFRKSGRNIVVEDIASRRAYRIYDQA